MKFSFAKFKISSMLVFKNHPSIRFCFIDLTHFNSVMGLLQNFKIHSLYSHISSVSSKHPYSPMSSILCEVSFHTDKILIHIVMKSFRFCPCWPLLSMSKVSSMSSIFISTYGFVRYLSHTHRSLLTHNPICSFWKSSLGSRTYC